LSRVESTALVHAAAIAWPLRSEAAFRKPRGSAEREMAEELERYLLRRPALTVDDVDGGRAALWPPVMDPAEVVGHLVRHARGLLRVEGARVIVEGVGADPEAIARWRAVSLLMPADVLVAALCAEHLDAEALVASPSLLPPQLRRWLEEQRLAECHLHLGSAGGHVALWTDVMMRPDSLVRELERPSVPERVRTLARRMLACAVMRPFLGRALVGAPGLELHAIDVGAVLEVRAPLDVQGVDAALRVALRVLHLLCQGDAPFDPFDARLMATAARQLLWRATVDGRIVQTDPFLAELGDRRPGDVPAETRLIAVGLRRVLREQAPPSVAAALVQYLRVRAQVFADLVQEPGVAGLAWFRRYFHRTAALRERAPDGVVRALRCHEGDVPLRGFEVRAAPQPDLERNLALVRSVASAAHVGTEVGLVLHLTTSLRRRDDRSRDEAVWHGAWVREKLAEVASIERLLEAVPESLVFVRGVDLAGRELALPTWVPIGPLQALRRAGDRAAVRLRIAHPDWRVDGLRATHHAGEEFLTVTQGLRRVHALIQHGLLRPGDRIGHALAVGVEIETWARRRHASLPQMERLEDLLFEFERYRAGTITEVTAGRLAFIRAEAEALGHAIFGGHPLLSHLVEWRRAMHEPAALNALGYPFEVSRAQPAGALVVRTLVDPDVRTNAVKPVEVRLDRETGAMTALQQFVRRELARREITIESNPTSNLLIGASDRIGEAGVLALGSEPLVPRHRGLDRLR
jgi:hypothetical protein